MPGKVNWEHSAQSTDLNFAVWPLFRALDADALLTIAEVSVYTFKLTGLIADFYL